MKPTKTRSTGDTGWIYEVDSYYHRSNGPALEWDNGRDSWWLKGLLHRYYGTATILPGRSWYMHGKLIK